MCSMTSILKVVSLSLCVWGLLVHKTFLKTELFYTDTLKSVFTLAGHDESEPAWIPGSPSKVWELPGDWRKANLPARKSEVREWVKYFYCGFWKNIAKPKELFGSYIFKNH